MPMMTDDQKVAVQAARDAEAAQKARADAAEANAEALAKAEAERDALLAQVAALQTQAAEALTGPAGFITVDHTGRVVS